MIPGSETITLAIVEKCDISRLIYGISNTLTPHHQPPLPGTAGFPVGTGLLARRFITSLLLASLQNSYSRPWTKMLHTSLETLTFAMFESKLIKEHLFSVQAWTFFREDDIFETSYNPAARVKP